jgi:hypothetical protein
VHGQKVATLRQVKERLRAAVDILGEHMEVFPDESKRLEYLRLLMKCEELKRAIDRLELAAEEESPNVVKE